jgi:hypothetical protein
MQDGSECWPTSPDEKRRSPNTYRAYEYLHGTPFGYQSVDFFVRCLMTRSW